MLHVYVIFYTKEAMLWLFITLMMGQLREIISAMFDSRIYYVGEDLTDKAATTNVLHWNVHLVCTN